MKVEINGGNVLPTYVRHRMQALIEESIGESRSRELREVQLYLASLPDYCVVVLRTPKHTRRRFFLGDIDEIMPRLGEWLRSNPLTCIANPEIEPRHLTS